MDFRASILPMHYVSKLMGLAPFSFSNKISVHTKQNKSNKGLLSPNVLWSSFRPSHSTHWFHVANALEHAIRLQKLHFICHSTRRLNITDNLQHVFCFPHRSCVQQKKDGKSNEEHYCYRSNSLTRKL
jgi:hypothetical protein